MIFFVAIYKFVWSGDQISDELVSETADATDDLQPQWSQGPDSVRYTEGAEDNGRCVRPSSCLTPSWSSNAKPTFALKPRMEL